MAKGFDGDKFLNELINGFKNVGKQAKKTEVDIDKYTESIVNKTKSTKKSTTTDQKLAQQMQANTAALNRLASATNKASNNKKRYNKEGILALRNNRLLGGSFATLRSKLLLAAFGFGLINRSLGKLIDAQTEFEASQKRINGILTSTGRFTEELSAEMFALSDRLEESTGIAGTMQNEVIALGLSFGNISTREIPRFAETVNDMTVFLNQGHVTMETLKTSSIMLGKALNDPVQGISALRRVGIAFSAEQMRQVKFFDMTGQRLKAQILIMEELEKQTGGAASIEGMEKNARELNTAFGNLQKAIGEELTPAFRMLQQFALDFVNALDPGRIKNFILALGGTAAVLKILQVSLSLTIAAQSKNLTIVQLLKTRYDALTASMMKSASGAKLYSERLRKMQFVVSALSGPLGFVALAGTIATVITAFTKGSGSIKDYTDQLNENQSDIDLETKSIKELVTFLKETTPTLEQLETAHKRATDEIKKFEGGNRKSIETLKKAAIVNISLSAANGKNQEGLDGVAKAFSEGGKEVNDYTQKILKLAKDRDFKALGKELDSMFSSELMKSLDEHNIKIKDAANFQELFEKNTESTGFTNNVLKGTMEKLIRRLDDTDPSFAKILDNLVGFGKNIGTVDRIVKILTSDIKANAGAIRTQDQSLIDSKQALEDIIKLQAKRATLTDDEIKIDQEINANIQKYIDKQNSKMALDKLAITSTKDLSKESQFLIPHLIKLGYTQDRLGNSLLKGANTDFKAIIDVMKEFTEVTPELSNKLLDFYNTSGKADAFSGKTFEQLKLELELGKTIIRDIGEGAKLTTDDIFQGLDPSLIKLRKTLEELFKQQPKNFFNDFVESMGLIPAQVNYTIKTIASMVDQMQQLGDSLNQIANKRIEKTFEEDMARASLIRNDTLRAAQERRIEAKREQERKKAFEKQKKFNVAQALIKGAQAIMNIYSEPAPKGMDFISSGFVRGIRAALQVALTAKQIELMQAPTYATGGYVGGNLHSQGGTMIEAERGEFVVNRRSAQALGRPFLEQMNSTTQSSPKPIGSTNIVINFEGNVLSDEFLEEEAIPKIKDALRRGFTL